MSFLFFLVPQHDIAEKLLKLAFNTNESVNLPYSVKFYLDVMPFVSFVILFSNCGLGIWLNMSPTIHLLLRSVVSSTNKTDSHDITEILLKVVLNTINLTHVLSLC